MSHGLKHLNKHSQKHHGTLAKLFDKSMYVIAIGAPLMTLPQFLQVWQSRHIQGVSLSTWSAYTVFSAMWVIYGLLHKDKVILLSNIPMLILDGAVALGVLLLH